MWICRLHWFWDKQFYKYLITDGAQLYCVFQHGYLSLLQTVKNEHQFRIIKDYQSWTTLPSSQDINYMKHLHDSPNHFHWMNEIYMVPHKRLIFCVLSYIYASFFQTLPVFSINRVFIWNGKMTSFAGTHATKCYFMAIFVHI